MNATVPAPSHPPLRDGYLSLLSKAGLVLSSSFLGYEQYRSIVLAAESRRPVSS